jgi:hypothetical protein
MDKEFIEQAPEDRAFESWAFPSNPIPFLQRMLDIAKHKGGGAISSKEFRANLFIVLGQLYGQIATIDLFTEYQKLTRDFYEQDTKKRN